MFDLNNLKTANDTMGHSAGDRLIMDFARLLRSVISDKDFVGGITIDYACGWAISTDEGTYTLQMLLDKADSDMYENKQLCKKHLVENNLILY